MGEIGHEWKRPPGTPDTPEGDNARERDAAHTGRMMPIDPGAGAGGTIVSEATGDVAAGGAGSTEWGGGIETHPSTGVVDPSDDTDRSERR